ncbi:hypothetical protein RRF99_13450 [Escherichia coli]|uniref:hypothetical protein n=1 Tax=Enterobacteriaceae TaxID=543 RepID=UPI0005795F25|nr:hypothetical protein [Escherichia coli]EIX9597156.1 hypothetical protein [Klebsiella pneumoniae]MBW0975709.1 hypothetical protein [Shigella sonnei]EER8079765.1 hypothetical protein [Escherichia coli]EEV1018416.1 hypothetical protein [Escherichia coli]EEV6951114.1 hypothetical protein [Escherichia coli]
MKKQNYSTFTSYLSKTHKNVDLYRLYNPHFSSFCKSYSYDHDFYLTYFSRHMITERNILTIFSIYAHFSYGMTKKETIKDFILFLKNINSVVFWKSFSFRGCNVIYLDKKREQKEISWFTFSRIYDEVLGIKEYQFNNNTYRKTA